MNTSIFCRNSLLTVAVLSTALNLHGAPAEAAVDGVPGAGKPAASPLPPTMPPEIIKPAPPGELKSADAVFDRLDGGGRGYVTRRDTRDLIGFGKAFRAVDRNGSGKLTREQFRKAWTIYKAAK